MSSISSLVGSVLEGDLFSCAPLLDLLEEIGDFYRRRDLIYLLGSLSYSVDDIERCKLGYGTRVDMCSSTWRRFSCELKKTFWDVISDVPITDRLAAMEKTLDCLEQLKKDRSVLGSAPLTVAHQSLPPGRKPYRSKLLTEKRGLA